MNVISMALRYYWMLVWAIALFYAGYYLSCDLVLTCAPDSKTAFDVWVDRQVLRDRLGVPSTSTGEDGSLPDDSR